MKNLRVWTRFISYLVIILIIAQLFLMYKHNWFCTNFEPQRHINRMCELYKNGAAEGNLCIPLCDSQNHFTYTCQSYHTTKEAVFRVTWGDIRFVLKSAISNIPSIHWYDNGVLKYPSEKEFLLTLKTHI